jgi:hypothetical protein
LLYTLIALAVVVGVVVIGWKLFQLAHRKTAEETGDRPAESPREDWPFSNPS